MRSLRLEIKLRLLLSTVILLIAAASPLLALDQVQPFPLGEVRLLDSPFKQAQERDLRYMLQLEPDRLLAPFRREADLPKKAEPYGNWESSGLDGHTAGHYLSALSFMYASTGDPELLKRLNYMVAELAECQKANGDGYVGAVPGSKLFWTWIADGHAGDIGKKWVPWYNLHKTFAGLRDAWLVCGNAQAKVVLISFADWCSNTVSKLSGDQMQQMLKSEYGGMNEVLADVYAITGDKKYLELAKRFDHQAILAPLEAGQDRLDGLHANTQIPKIIGFQRIASLSGDPADQPLSAAAKFFWKTVTEHRSVVIGGNSTKEHFNPAADFTSMIANREGPESCNSYNMLKLTQDLFDADPQARYFDFAERVLYNHILTTMDDHGFVYFTPMRPGHYRVYSTPDQSFWCCVGTGMENHGKYGGFIYAQKPGALYVNLFIPSELNWKEQGVTLRQETKFPEEPKTHLSLKLDKSSAFTVYVRHPAWVKKGAFQMTINGAVQPDDSEPSSYVALNRTWKDGDVIDLTLPMETSTERLPDGLDDVAFLYGPIVLAAETGTNDMTGLEAGDGRWDHIANGPLVPLDQAPALICESDAIAKAIQPVPNKSLTFTLGSAVQPAKDQTLELVPFYRLADTRYVIYWQHFTPAQYQPKMDQIHAEEAAAMALDQATVDRVTPGEQQPEADHNFQGENTGTGYFQDRHWRDGKAWFSYDLKTVSGQPLSLAVTYWGGDKGRNFTILANDTQIADVSLQGDKPASFDTVNYPIPAILITQAPKGMLTIKFVAQPRSVAGGVFDVRLVKASK
jgi:uncharacterized protein